MFPSKVAGNFINGKVIFIKKDFITDDKESDLVKEYNVTAIPTFILFDGNGVELTRFVGGMSNVKMFISQLEEALQPENYNSAREKRFNEEPSYALEHLTYLHNNSMNDKAIKLFSDVFNKLSIEEKFSKKWLNFYKIYLRDLNSPVFEFMYANQKAISKIMGENEYIEFLKSKSMDILFYSTFSSNKETISGVVKQIDAQPLLQTGYSAFISKNIDVIVNNDCNALFKAIEDNIANFGTKTREYVLRFLEYRRYESKYNGDIIRIYEKASETESDNLAKQRYMRNVEEMRKIKS